MTECPWDRVLNLLGNYGCIIGQEDRDRLPIFNTRLKEVTNLPARSRCPTGVPLIVLRPSLEALGIDVDRFLRECSES